MPDGNIRIRVFQYILFNIDRHTGKVHSTYAPICVWILLVRHNIFDVITTIDSKVKSNQFQNEVTLNFNTRVYMRQMCIVDGHTGVPRLSLYRLLLYAR